MTSLSGGCGSSSTSAPSSTAPRGICVENIGIHERGIHSRVIRSLAGIVTGLSASLLLPHRHDLWRQRVLRSFLSSVLTLQILFLLSFKQIVIFDVNDEESPNDLSGFGKLCLFSVFVHAIQFAVSSSSIIYKAK